MGYIFFQMVSNIGFLNGPIFYLSTCGIKKSSYMTIDPFGNCIPVRVIQVVVSALIPTPKLGLEVGSQYQNLVLVAH